MRSSRSLPTGTPPAPVRPRSAPTPPPSMPRPLLSAVSPSFGDDPMRAAKPGQAPCAYLSRVRPTVQGWIWGAGVALVATFLLVTGTAAAAPPATPAITEPASDEQ